MRLTLVSIFAVQVLISTCCLFLRTNANSVAGTNDKNYWIKRKQEFYKKTSFDLNKDNIRLLGGKYSEIHQSHLPFWFDFELFKKVYNKTYKSEDEELQRHLTYIKTCVRTLKKRVLFRILAGTEDTLITKNADKFYHELVPQSQQNQLDGEISFSVGFDVMETTGEQPLEKAIRLVRRELDSVESRNQLINYLKAFDEVDGSAIAGSLPY